MFFTRTSLDDCSIGRTLFLYISEAHHALKKGHSPHNSEQQDWENSVKILISLTGIYAKIAVKGIQGLHLAS